MIKITKEPTSEPVTKDYVKKVLHWIDTDTDTDTVIEDYITAAREEIEKQANLSLASKSYSQWIYPENIEGYSINLMYPPHHTIDKVVRIDSDGTETALTLNSGYSLTKGKQYRITFDRVALFRVDFKSGYGDDYGQSLPTLLKVAIAEQVGQWFEGDIEVGILSDAVMAKVQKMSMNIL